jgi:Domain of unknown function (DUF4198)
VRVLHAGKPMPGLLLKSFNRGDAQSPRAGRTDAEGRVTVALPVAGEYLLSVVHIVPALAGDKADWSSLWASTTFKRP